MSEWRVTLTCRGDGDVEDSAMAAALGALKRYGAVGSVNAGLYGLTLAIDAPSSERARSTALRALEKARGAGLPDWPVAMVEVLQADDDVPALVGIPEIAELLGVHVERVRAIVRDNETFPRPVGQLGRSKVWTEAAVRTWAASWPRRSGRPPKAALAQPAAGAPPPKRRRVAAEIPS